MTDQLSLSVQSPGPPPDLPSPVAEILHAARSMAFSTRIVRGCWGVGVGPKRKWMLTGDCCCALAALLVVKGAQADEDDQSASPSVAAHKFPTPAVPFIKTVGGKRQLLPEIRKHVPERFGRYFEPFLGGGAVFFDLVSAGRLSRPVWLGDSNRSLVVTYDVILKAVDALIKELQRHARDHSEAHYYAVRKECPTTAIDIAARTIYLNKTCFNGLYRVNKSGQFNVPMGRYANPTICDEPNLRSVSEALRFAELHAGDFESVVDAAKSNDFIYLDCPYSGYTKDGFTATDQQRLRDVAIRMKRRGVYVLLSNADVPPVRALYASGFEMRRVEATRAINSKPGKRGTVGELLIW